MAKASETSKKKKAAAPKKKTSAKKEKKEPTTSKPNKKEAAAATAAWRLNVNFGSGLTAAHKKAFTDAAKRWMKIITAAPVKSLPIKASGVFIDEEGGTLGQAGPEKIHGASGLPTTGVMEFDTADLMTMEKDKTLLDVITHEMGHVIGIGIIRRSFSSEQGHRSRPLWAPTRG